MKEKILYRVRKLNAAVNPRHVFLPPKWLVLGVNNTCNLHCKMCDVGVNYSESNFYENLMGSKPLHMPMDLFRRIADQASHYYPGVRLGFAFTEPLIYTHLAEALAYAHRKNLFTSLTTNGLGLKKHAGVLDENKLSELNISLDGPEEIHNFIRGNRHSYSMAMAGIEELQHRHSAIGISVFCVITEWNVSRLTEFLEGLNPYPLRKVGLMHPNFTSVQTAQAHNEIFGNLYPATASNVTDSKVENIDLKVLWEELTSIGRRKWNFQVEFSPRITSFEKLESYYRKPEVFVGKGCLDIFSNIMIKSNGDVIPAHGRCYNLRIGNLYEQDLKEIWNSSVVSQFRHHVRQAGGLLPA